MPKSQRTWAGPGQWRSQADGAQRPDNPFAHLAEVHRRLLDAGFNTHATTVAEAIRALRNGDRQGAVDKMHKVSRSLPAQAAPLAAGLNELAANLPVQGTGGSADPEVELFPEVTMLFDDEIVFPSVPEGYSKKNCGVDVPDDVAARWREAREAWRLAQEEAARFIGRPLDMDD